MFLKVALFALLASAAVATEASSAVMNLRAALQASFLQKGDNSDVSMDELKAMLPMLKHLQEMVPNHGPSSWMNSAEHYASQARQAQSDARRAQKSLEASSMLEIEAESDSDANDEELKEAVKGATNETAEKEFGGNSPEAQAMKRSSVKELEKFIKNPALHDEEFQEIKEEFEAQEQEKNNWVNLVAKNGFIGEGNNKMLVMTKDKKMLSQLYSMMKGGSDFLHGLGQPMKSLGFGSSLLETDEASSHNVNARSAALLKLGSTDEERAELEELAPQLENMYLMMQESAASWFNGIESYAKRAREAASAKRRQTSLLQMSGKEQEAMSAEQELSLRREKLKELTEDMKKQEEEKLKKSSASFMDELKANQTSEVSSWEQDSIKSLEKYLEKPEELDKMIEEEIAFEKEQESDKLKWVDQVAKLGFIKMGGEKHQLLSTNKKDLMEMYNTLPASFLEIDDDATPTSTSLLEEFAEKKTEVQEKKNLLQTPQWMKELLQEMPTEQKEKILNKMPEWMKTVNNKKEFKAKMLEELAAKAEETEKLLAKNAEKAELAAAMIEESGSQKTPASLMQSAAATSQNTAEANMLLKDSPPPFQKALKQWEKLSKEIVTVLLNNPKGTESKQDEKISSLTTRAEKAQEELKGSAQGGGYAYSLLQAAQNRVISRVTQQAVSEIEARKDGEIFPSMASCTKVAADSKSEHEALESKCICVTDKVCGFASGGHGERAANLCNLLAQGACLSQDEHAVAE